MSGRPGLTTVTGATCDSLIPFGGPLCGSMQMKSGSSSNTTNHGCELEISMRNCPGHSIEAARDATKNVSSNARLPQSTAIKAPESRKPSSRSASSGSGRLQTAGSPEPICRLNHGCQPTTPGNVCSSASRVRRVSTASAPTSQWLVSRPAHGHFGPRSVTTVATERSRVEYWSTNRGCEPRTVPWMAHVS